MCILLVFSLAVIVLMLAAQIVAIWRGADLHGSLVASWHAVARANAVEFDRMVLRLHHAGHGGVE